MQDSVQSNSPMIAFGMAGAGALRWYWHRAALVLTLTSGGGGGAALAAGDESSPDVLRPGST